MFLDVRAGARDWIEIYRLCIGFINPRPIALTSTLAPDGRRNLAPFSFYNMVCARPPVVMISCGKNRHGRDKDTFRNIESTREFVIATVTSDIAEPMVRCAADLPYGESEFDFSGLTPTPARLVRAPWVQEAVINLECRLRQILPIGDGGPGSANLVFGDVLGIHVRDDLLDAGGLIDPRKLHTVGRLGGTWYSDVLQPYELHIPSL